MSLCDASQLFNHRAVRVTSLTFKVESHASHFVEISAARLTSNLDPSLELKSSLEVES